MDINWVHKPKRSRWPIDILLATNMIAVGVDVARLGLMLINGQPKTTAEYIQASSRVGRSKPGMVLTLYNPAKNRDRSHFERFIAYHQGLYRYVEPTSVTPFSPPARERGMRGILIALARMIVGMDSPANIEYYLEPLKREIEWLLARVRDIDEEEFSSAKKEIEDWLNQWRHYKPSEFGKMFGKPETLVLAYPYGRYSYKKHAWPVLTSLRNVDATCRAAVLESTLEHEGDAL
jgi:hypothetical protein